MYQSLFRPCNINEQSLEKRDFALRDSVESARCPSTPERLWIFLFYGRREF